MNAAEFLLLRTALMVAAFPGASLAGNCLLNPVTTYSNGMPLASSTSMRSHNVYWQGDPERTGECDGRYNCPCVNQFHCRREPFIGATEPLVGQAERLPDGLEAETAVVLGVVSIDPSAPRHAVVAPPTAPVAAPAGAPASGVWLEALQSLQRKIMIDPEKGY